MSGIGPKQRVRGLPALFRDPDEERRARTPAAVEDQRQAVIEDGAVLAAQPLVAGEDAGFGPVAGKLDTPRPPGRVGASLVLANVSSLGKGCLMQKINR
jgi:hypothetical protein